MTQALTLARPYARAAFSIAREAGAFAQWSDALAFSARVAADPQVAGLLGHPRLDDADAVALLSPGGDGAGQAFADFLALLAENRRLALLPEIAGQFEQLRADAERIVRARVTSASELPAGELEGIRAALKKRFGREVELETAVDEALIGGAVIAAGDVVIDGSLRGKLARLQSALAS
ncbi:F0F1 ATP synthase subunit delta [Luteimonas sp. R10]|uniref:F0F1 ATP synthase subunit delta n=1 Tax=Luteimonas sp. R10 TaxID=3108176 RepID=UPI0030881C03|nr:F0F1 ATP synthase subunit delta [Luteimonas sp. R10]